MGEIWCGREVVRGWCALTSLEIGRLVEKQEKEDVVVILPVGSCEQHGPHLPVGTDTMIGFLLARAASERCKCPTLVLPPIWVGYSPHHMSAPGTVTLGEETLIAVIYDICYSLFKQNLKKVLFVNSHGGNAQLLAVAVNKAARQFNLFPVVVTYWHLLATQIAKLRKSPVGGTGHAGELETSLALYLFPELVKLERAVSAPQPGDKYFSPEMFSKNLIHCYVDYLKLSPSGIVGDPFAGSAQEGKRLFSILVTELCKLIEDFSKGNIAVLKTMTKGEEYENC